MDKVKSVHGNEDETSKIAERYDKFDENIYIQKIKQLESDLSEFKEREQFYRRLLENHGIAVPKPDQITAKSFGPDIKQSTVNEKSDITKYQEPVSVNPLILDQNIEPEQMQDQENQKNFQSDSFNYFFGQQSGFTPQLQSTLFSSLVNQQDGDTQRQNLVSQMLQYIGTMKNYEKPQFLQDFQKYYPQVPQTVSESFPSQQQNFLQANANLGSQLLDVLKNPQMLNQTLLQQNALGSAQFQQAQATQLLETIQNQLQSGQQLSNEQIQNIFLQTFATQNQPIKQNGEEQSLANFLKNCPPIQPPQPMLNQPNLQSLLMFFCQQQMQQSDLKDKLLEQSQFQNLPQLQGLNFLGSQLFGGTNTAQIPAQNQGYIPQQNSQLQNQQIDISQQLQSDDYAKENCVQQLNQLVNNNENLNLNNMYQNNKLLSRKKQKQTHPSEDLLARQDQPKSDLIQNHQVNPGNSDNPFDFQNDDYRYNQTPTNGQEPHVRYNPWKSSRISWRMDLHQRFEYAINQLGGPDKATPKRILEIMELMGDKSLTIYHIKSHLQKYRLQIQSHQQRKGQIDGDLLGYDNNSQDEDLVSHSNMPNDKENNNDDNSQNGNTNYNNGNGEHQSNFVNMGILNKNQRSKRQKAGSNDLNQSQSPQNENGHQNQEGQSNGNNVSDENNCNNLQNQENLIQSQ